MGRCSYKRYHNIYKIIAGGINSHTKLVDLTTTSAFLSLKFFFPWASHLYYIFSFQGTHMVVYYRILEIKYLSPGSRRWRRHEKQIIYSQRVLLSSSPDLWMPTVEQRELCKLLVTDHRPGRGTLALCMWTQSDDMSSPARKGTRH